MQEQTENEKPKRKPTACSICHCEGHTKVKCPTKPYVKPLRVAPELPQIQQTSRIGENLASVVSTTMATVNTTLHEESDEDSNIDDVEATLPLGDVAEVLPNDAQSSSDDDGEEKIDENGVAEDLKTHLKQLEWREYPMGRVEHGNTRWRSYERRSYPTFRPGKQTGRKNTESVGEGDCAGFFHLFFDNTIMENFVSNTNAYASSTKDSDWKKQLTVKELDVFFACIIYLGIVRLPTRRAAWSKNERYSIPFLKNLMSGKRFEAILRNLHYVNTAALTTEEKAVRGRQSSFWQVQEFLVRLSGNFYRYFSPGQFLDIDEMCIYFKGRHKARCYNPNKPEKWHFKAFCMNDADTGYLLDFFMYEGKDEKRPTGQSATTYPVLRLTNHNDLYHNNHIICLDNWYQSPELVPALREKGFHTVGTLRTNRLGVYKDGVKKKNSKFPRGHSKCYHTKIRTYDTYMTAWTDNKNVHVLHTYPSTISTVERVGKNNTGAFVRLKIDRPDVVGHYNRGMGGTDLFDQFGSYYRTNVRKKKWPPRIIFHFLLGAAINTRIIAGTSATLLDFLDELITGLIAGANIDIVESDNEDIVPTMPLKRQRTITWKTDHSRLHGKHTPTFIDGKRAKCMCCHDVNKVSIRCCECNVYLHVKGDSSDNCWWRFHNLVDFEIVASDITCYAEI